MRVISGTLRGRRLSAPAGLITRPTSDRVREAVFSILGGRIQAKMVLDLFAGTGAMGIEALSRGAGKAIFVDHDRAALTTLRSNIQALGLTDRSRVVGWDIRGRMPFLSTYQGAIELVFMDPPYGKDLIQIALSALPDSGALAPEARIVIEHGQREKALTLPSMFKISDQRRYGKTLVSFLDCVL